MAGKPYDPACPECGGRGFTWTEPHQCTCGTGEQGYYGMHEPLCGAEPCALGCEVQPPRDCPDGGSCGHGCRAGGCFRVACCSPLSVWGDYWPMEVRAAERARGGPWWNKPPSDSETTGGRTMGDTLTTKALGSGNVVSGHRTELAAGRGENWMVPCDRGSQTLDEWLGDQPMPQAAHEVVSLVRNAWDHAHQRHCATLRLVGWLDQKGVVWTEIPSGLEYNGGSYTPLLIDVREG